MEQGTQDSVIIVRADELAWNEVDDQIVVLDTKTSTYHAVSGSGVVLWPLLVAGTTREALLAHLTSTFEVSADQADADLQEFLTACAPLLRSH